MTPTSNWRRKPREASALPENYWQRRKAENRKVAFPREITPIGCPVPGSDLKIYIGVKL